MLLTILVFVAGQVLPGSPGREILGNSASRAAVAALDKQLGLNRSLFTQYLRWSGGILHGDLGESYEYRAPVAGLLWPALLRSLELGGLAFVIVVPTSLAAGVVTSLYRGRRLDWIITTLGSSLATVPEFVSGTILIVVFALGLKWLPVEAEAQGSFGSRLVSLLLPALSLDGVIFGYILRVARAGMVDALESDYVRTATLKGLPRWQVVRRHVLRNALSPAVTVIATEVSFLIGGLVVIETLFNYPGLGRLIYQAAQYKDFPMLEAGVLVIGVVFVLGTLIADVLYVVLNPRVRFEASD